MQRTRLGTRFLIGASLLLGGVQARAQDTGLADIYKREAAVNRLSSGLFRFNGERTLVGQDTSGLASNIQSYAQNSAAWMNDYRTLADALSSTISLDDLQTLVHNSLRTSATHRSALRKQARDILDKFAEVKVELALNGNMDPSDQLRPAHDDLAKKSAAFSKAMDDFQNHLASNERQMDKISEAFSADFFLLRYQILAVKLGLDKNGPLAVAFRQYIDAEIFAANIYESLDHITIEASQVMLALEGQHLKRLMPQINKTCQDAAQKIASSTLAKEQKDRITADVSAQCSKVQNDYNATILSYSPAVLAQFMQAKKLKKHRLSCSTSGSLCDQYTRLSKINSASLTSTNDEALDYLEQQWSSFEHKKKAINP